METSEVKLTRRIPETIKSLSTKELVKELILRTGVSHKVLGFSDYYSITTIEDKKIMAKSDQGPAIILVVID